MTKFLPIEEAVAKIHSGSLLAMSGNNHKSSMAITRELVRQNVGDLKLVFTPAGGINGDMLIGAGLVTAVEKVDIGQVPSRYSGYNLPQ